MRFAIASLLILLPSLTFAEEPRIKIVKSSKLNIAITGLSGADLETLKIGRASCRERVSLVV